MALKAIQETKTYGITITNTTGEAKTIAITSGLASDLADLKTICQVDAICSDGPIFVYHDIQANQQNGCGGYVKADSRNGIPISMFQEFLKKERMRISEIAVTVNDSDILNKGMLMFLATSPFSKPKDDLIHFTEHISPYQLNSLKVVIDFAGNKTNTYLDHKTALLLSLPESPVNKYQSIDIYITLETGREFLTSATNNKKTNWIKKTIERLKKLVQKKRKQ